LWDCPSNSLTSEEKDLFFDWLKDVCTERVAFVINPEVSKYLFVEKLSKLDFGSLTDVGLDCFERWENTQIGRRKDGKKDLKRRSKV